MWIFTNYGFVSAVAHRSKKGTLCVRAREPGVLEMLAERHNLKIKVVKNRFADYLYRAEISKNTFADIIAEEVRNIDYSNFKNSFSAAIPENSHVSHMALMDVWCTMNGLQQKIEYKDTRNYSQLCNSDFDGLFGDEINHTKTTKRTIGKRK